MQRRNLLLFGCDYFSTKRTSEINFWNDMVSRLASYFNEIVILSVNNRKISQEKLPPNVTIYNERPYYWGNSGRWKDPEYTGARFHKLPFANLYKSYTFWRLQPVFDQIVERHNIRVVHYMRVFGFLNQQLIKRHPDILFSITVPTHIDRGFPLHLLYHALKNAALDPMDRIIPTCEATYQRLVALGLSAEKQEVIHWSLEPEPTIPASSISMRKQLGFFAETNLILWSGPLQHTGKKEFLFSLEVAKRVSQVNDQFAFVFAFKPDKLRQEYLEAAAGHPNIRIFETGRDDFCALRQEASLFLSPICDVHRTVAPPLTWIEMMSMGVPIVTTDVAGASELIEHGKSGFIVNTVEETANLICDIEVTAQIQQRCCDVIQQSYNLDIIAAQYVSMWQRGSHALGKGLT